MFKWSPKTEKENMHNVSKLWRKHLIIVFHNNHCSTKTVSTCGVFLLNTFSIAVVLQNMEKRAMTKNEKNPNL